MLTYSKSVVKLLISTIFLSISFWLSAQPYNWSNVEIIAGGYVTGFVYHPTAPGVAYLRTDIGGAYRFNSTGQVWEPITDLFSAADWNMMGIESIAIDPTNSNIVYIACGTYAYNNWAGNGAIFRSTDRGTTWTRTNLSFKLGANEDGRGMGERLIVDPNAPNILYLGTRQNGLWRSTNSGASWSQVTSFPNVTTPRDVGLGFVVIDPSSGSAGNPSQTIYVGAATATGNNLFRSTNGGTSWTAITGGPSGMMPHRAVLTSSTNMYLTYSDAAGPNGITNGVVVKLNPSIGAWTTLKTQDIMGGYAGLAVDPTNSNIVMVGTICRWWPSDEVYRSIDGGATWKAVGVGTNTPTVNNISRSAAVSPYLRWGAADDAGLKTGNWVSAMAFDPFNTNKFIYGTGATVWGADNIKNIDTGGNILWTIKAKGVEETAVLDIKSPNAGPYLLSGLGDIAGFIHNDIRVSPPQGMIDPTYKNIESVDFAELLPSKMVIIGHDYTPTYFGSYSTNAGANWTKFPSIPSGATDGIISLSANGNTIIWAPNNMAPYRSTNNGTSWTAVNGIGGPATMVSDKVNSNKFYAIRNNVLYRSTDGGINFTPGASLSFSGSNRLKTVPGFENHIWVPANDGMYRSTDGGLTFTKINTGPQSVATLGFGKNAIGQSYPAIYFVGTNSGQYGIFRSIDQGATWVRINDNLHQFGNIGREITGDPRVFGRVYIASNGRGIILGEDQSPLPVDILDFYATQKNNITTLNWSVANEVGIDYYEVQYASNPNAKDWTTVDVVSATNTGGVKQYQSSISNPNEGYYRLVTNEQDGVKGIVYVSALVTEQMHVRLYPNPISKGDTWFIRWDAPIATAHVKVYSALGNVVFDQVMENNSAIPISLSSGYYSAVIQTDIFLEQQTLIVE
jgi:hypothetical protein